MPLPKAKITDRLEVWLKLTLRGFSWPSASLMPWGKVFTSSSTSYVPWVGTPMAQEPLGPDLVVPVKSPLLAVMLTPASGARSSPRRKPLMLFWNEVLDGDGVGEGVAARDAGATMSRRAATAAKMAPTAFSILPRRLCDRPLGLLLKMKTYTWGWSGLRRCNRCERSGDEGWSG